LERLTLIGSPDIFERLTVFERDFPGNHISVEGNRAGFVTGVQFVELQVKVTSAPSTGNEMNKKNSKTKSILKNVFFILI